MTVKYYDYVQKYVHFYEDVISIKDCHTLMNAEFAYKPSKYATHKSESPRSEERVKMDDAWIGENDEHYNLIKSSFEFVIKEYQKAYKNCIIKNTTPFRINRYSVGGFMSEHCDNIHHSHGQTYGYPQLSALLFLNDDYEGGEFMVNNLAYPRKKGSAIIFPSNFMYQHQVTEIKKGTRWSIVTWLM